MKSIEKKTILKKNKKKQKLKLINFAKLYSAIKIQRFFKSYLKKIVLLDKINTTQKFNEEFLNDTTFIGKPLDKLDKLYFYKHSNHFFDIRELYEHLRLSDKHPYTNIKFSKFVLRQINRIYYKIIKNPNYIDIGNEDTTILSNKNLISGLKTDIFLKIDESIGASNLNSFNNYDEYDLLYYIENIMNYSLINQLFNSEILLHRIYYLYDKFKSEMRYYRIRDNSYFNKFYKDRFNFHYKILDTLLRIVNYKDNNSITRCHILNENIFNVIHINDNIIINSD